MLILKILNNIAVMVATAIMWLMLAIGAGGFAAALISGIFDHYGITSDKVNVDFLLGLFWGMIGAIVATWLLTAPFKRNVHD